MKNLIIIIGTILLGIVIVNTLVLGDENSLKSTADQIMEKGSGRDPVISGFWKYRRKRGRTMKELVVIIGTVILGAYIFNMMTGDEEDSLRNISGQIMERTLMVMQEDRP